MAEPNRGARSARGPRALRGLILVPLLLALACDSGPAVEPDEPPPRAHRVAKPQDEAKERLPMGLFGNPQWDFSDPHLATTRQGSAALVWLGFDGSADRVFAATFEAGGWSPVFPVSEAVGRHLPPRVSAIPGGGFQVVWSQRVDGQYDLFGARIAAGAAETVERITQHPGPDTDPALIATWDGRIWVVWRSLRKGQVDLYTRVREGDAWGPPRPVTFHPRSDIQPAVGLGPDGTPWVAWSAWRHGRYADGNYEILARPLDQPAGRPPLRVSTSNRTDMFPRFVRQKDGLALVWTESVFPNTQVGDIAAVQYDNWGDKTYQVAWLEGDRFSKPVSARLSPDHARGSVASPTVTAVPGPEDLGVWLLYGERIVRTQFDRTWSMRLARVERDGVVSEPIDMGEKVTGPTQRYAAGWWGPEIWMVDTLLHRTPPPKGPVKSALRLRRLEPASLDEPAALVERAAQPRSAVDPSLQLNVGPETRPEIEVGGTRYRAYYGNLHIHSDFSGDRRGFEGSLEENYQVVADIAELDFIGFSDHVEGLREVDWWNSRKYSDLWNRPGEFVALPGFEWTSLNYGHKNVFFPDTRVADESVPFGANNHTPDDLFAHLGDRPALVIPHHTSHGFRQPTDWSFRNDRFQRLVEIFQKRGSYEHDNGPKADIPAHWVNGHSVQDALAMGHRVGIIASPDHGGGLGLAGVWAEKLTRESIFQALVDRRTYGTTGAKMDLYLEVAGAVQGSEIPRPAGPIRIRGRVGAGLPGLTLTLVRDGEEIQDWQFDGDSAEIEWQDAETWTGTRYYYLRARRSDGHMGWTSPVWVRSAVNDGSGSPAEKIPAIEGD